MSKKVALFSLLFFALFKPAFAFDFSAVCSTGQTLYYSITSSSSVELIAPGGVVYSSSNWAGYTRPTGNIIIPSSVSYGGTTYSVTSMAGGTFMLCDQLTSIAIPNSIKYIGSWALASSGIATINYPTTAIWVEEFVLSGTPWLESQPDGLVYLGNTLYCFKGNMPENYALTIPSNTNSIAGRAFSPGYEVGYTNLVSVSIPNSVEYIGGSAFYKCHLNSLTLPSSLKVIGSHAFGCNYFTNVTIPSEVISIGSSAFAQCGSLTTVVINARSITDDQQLISPFYNCPYLTTVSFGNNVQHIPANLCSGCSSITGSLSLPSSLLSIGEYAFDGCTGLVGSITIPNSTTEIGQGAFYGCTGITTVTIGTSVNAIGGGAFGNMSNLTTVNYNAINCANATYPFGYTICSFNIGSTVQAIPDNLIYYCENLTSVTLPNSITRIGSSNFSSCGLQGVLSLPPSLNNVGFGAFNNNPGITAIQSNVTTPPTIESLNGMSNAFNNGNIDIPIIVPCGTVSAYQNAPGWSYFTNYQEPAGCTHQISASAYPSNGGTVSGGGTYNSGANCTLTATPNANNIFINWTENGTPVSSNASYSFTVLGDRTLVANFQYQQPSTFTITASASPANGGTISGTGTYDQGATCTLSATPSYGYVFLRWTENGNQVSTNPTYSFTVNGNRTLVANFQYDPPTYTINASANPSNGGSISGAGTFIEGQVCTLTASPNSGFAFLKWTENGTQVSTNSTYSFTVNSNRTLVAHFQSQPSQYTVTLSANPNNGGSVSGGGTYNQGQTCNITANANPNYSFENWTENGTQVSANSTYSFTVTGNRTLVANFSYSPTGYVINATAEPSYGGLVSGAGTYNQGRTCTLIATPNPNYDFVNWTEGGNVVSTSPTYSFTVNGNRTLVAHFESQVYTISVSANPSDGGTVYGGGDYSAGITCHLIAVPNNNYSFLNWTENGVAVSSESDYSFVVTGNRTLTANFVFYDAIEESTNNIMVYPNPTNDVVFIKGCEVSKVEVYDLMGQFLLSKENLGENTTISLRHLSSGLYLLRLYADDDIVIVRVAKE